MVGWLSNEARSSLTQSVEPVPCGYAQPMRQLFTALVIAALFVGVVAVIGPSLPEGNPIRGIGESIRAVGSGIGGGIGGGFGGGYRPLTP